MKAFGKWGEDFRDFKDFKDFRVFRDFKVFKRVRRLDEFSVVDGRGDGRRILIPFLLPLRA